MELRAPVVRGGVSGVAGTAVMSVLMLAARRAGLMGRQPPQVISERAVELVVGHRPPEPVARALGVAVHLAFGIGSGGAYALLPRRLPPEVRGGAFGLAVWVASYQGWVPAIGALPQAIDDRRDRVAVMVLAHLVYGAVLGRVEQELRPARP